MEKNKPHCPLSRVKALIEAGKVHMTTTARNGAAALGYDRKRAYAEINECRCTVLQQDIAHFLEIVFQKVLLEFHSGSFQETIFEIVQIPKGSESDGYVMYSKSNKICRYNID